MNRLVLGSHELFALLMVGTQIGEIKEIFKIFLVLLKL